MLRVILAVTLTCTYSRTKRAYFTVSFMLVCSNEN